MDIQNRMDDVVTLRAHAFQDYFEMILIPGWQEKLYAQAERFITERSQYADKYRPAYDKMREVGLENYHTTDMDVTLMATIALYMSGILNPAPYYTTKSAIKQIADDRNITNHASSNEEKNELYLRGLVALCNLQAFIKAIDRGEEKIPHEQRTAYFKKYMPKIKSLMNLIDDERFELVGRQHEMDRDIRAIQNSANPEKAWIAYWESYNVKQRETKDYSLLDEFCLRASDAGIKQAHKRVLNHYFFIERNWEECLHYIWKMYAEPDDTPDWYAYDILPIINWGIHDNLPQVDELKKIMENAQAKGLKIHINADGTYGRHK